MSRTIREAAPIVVKVRTMAGIWAAAGSLVIAAFAQGQVVNSPYPNQTQNQNPNQNQNQNQSQNQPKPAQPPPGNSAAAAKAKQAQADQAMVSLAQKDWVEASQRLQAVMDGYRMAFHQTKPWMDADKKLSDARSALSSAHDAVLDNLSKDSDYQAAVADRKKAQADLDAAKASDTATPETITPLAQTVLDDAAKIRKLERQAMDEDAGVVAAKAKLADSQSAMDQLNSQFDSSLAGVKPVKDAQDAVDGARKKLQAAQARLHSDS
jgi:hypothetical protein